MTLNAANASLKPGWRIVREGRQFALLWQSRQTKLGRYKILVGSLREVMAAYHDLMRPLPGNRVMTAVSGEPSGQRKTRQVLSEIDHWFTEGFETKDLQEAKALLEKLT